MKPLLMLLFVAPALVNFSCSSGGKKNNRDIIASDSIEIIRSDLNYPWEILWGPDNHIWMTERDGKISRINPVDGATTFSYSIHEVESIGEGGLLGMALHPQFPINGFLYVVYDYRNTNGYREKLVRFTYRNNTLTDPFVLIDDIAAAGIHNGSRLWVTNEAQPKIFMTTGDASEGSNAQLLNSMSGKILRLNSDGSIPSDNPFPGNPVWTYGHRNPQGLVLTNGILYASEHGPSIEDEVNIIEKGRNYGWPEVNGPCNGTEAVFCTSHDVNEPIWSSGNNTVAVCGLDYYNNNRIPQWKNSLLMLTLKNSSLRQLILGSDGKSITGETVFFKNVWGRLRDLCISPDGKVYICTSNGSNKDLLIEISKIR